MTAEAASKGQIWTPYVPAGSGSAALYDGCLGAGEEVVGLVQPVGPGDRDGDVVDRGGDGDRVDLPGEVVLELEGVHRATGRRSEGAGERVVVGRVVDLVATEQHLAGHGVDQDGGRERRTALGHVHHVGLVGRSHRVGPGGQRAQADLLLLAQAGHLQPGPAAERGGGIEHLDARGPRARTDVGSRLQPAVEGRERRGGRRAIGPGERGGHVGDLSVGHTDGDQSAIGRDEVAVPLPEEHGARCAAGERLCVDQLEVRDLCCGETEHRCVLREPGARPDGRCSRCRAEGAVLGEDRGGGAEVVPPQDRGAEGLDRGTLQCRRRNRGARVLVPEPVTGSPRVRTSWGAGPGVVVSGSAVAGEAIVVRVEIARSDATARDVRPMTATGGHARHNCREGGAGY